MQRAPSGSASPLIQCSCSAIKAGAAIAAGGDLPEPPPDDCAPGLCAPHTRRLRFCRPHRRCQAPDAVQSCDTSAPGARPAGALIVDDFPRLGRQVGLQKVAKTAFSDETNSVLSFLSWVTRSCFSARALTSGFSMAPIGKSVRANCFFTYRVEKVTLVFVVVQTFAQPRMLALLSCARVVPGGD